ncbi:Ldh family oxidoreductase [Oceanobacillus sp. FSL W8-0428]|uniref:Malate dehydrogenase n=1 Tax=Oceanobacillus sojae TaxID=582851 RepID=A0A511ZK04_9BACI|nr:Ldh family oxidoreductase [Oceanobacillus sojae]GEN87792.1 malate dehydrogenase [Oceanobacillus sojae]
MYTMKLSNVETFTLDALQAVGVDKKEAEICAKNISFADKQGTDTHGIMRVPVYIERLQSGAFNAKPNTKWVKETDTMAVLDADDGMGHYPAQLAMEKAIEKAREKGIGFATLYNGNHIGAGACYAQMAAEQGMIGFLTTNAGSLMAPSGGKERVLGNNPLCFSIPRKGKDPITLDIANSVVAGGKLQLASSKGEEIPLGWALDAEGNPTTDPDKGLEGTLVPIGGHKGYGLTLIMDILAGVLSGANYSKNISLLDYDKPNKVGCTMIVIDIDKIMPLDRFYDRLDDFTAIIVNSEKIDKNGHIYLPGEIEAQTKQKRLEAGVDIADSLHEELVELCKELNLDKEKYGL